MSVGLRVWDGVGTLTFDTNDYVGRFLGSVAAGSGTGSITDARLTTGIPFAVPVFIQPNMSYPILNLGVYTSSPVISFSGATMIFTRTPDTFQGAVFPACTIWYGVR
jgi:hypothetical protein